MEFDRDFIDAFNHAMIYEVGGFWNPDDQDVIQGKFQTREQRQKVGYVNIPADRGGETKYGVAQKANPDVDVRNLDLAGAMEVYFRRYWYVGKCFLLPYPVSLIHFDGCVNHGPRRAAMFLQQAVGVVPDSEIGNQTIEALDSMSYADAIKSISDQRVDFYNAIVRKDPSQKVFLKGWMRRITEVTEFCLNALN